MVACDFFSCYLGSVWGSYDSQTVAYKATFHSSRHPLHPCTMRVVNGSSDKTLSSVLGFMVNHFILKREWGDKKERREIWTCFSREVAFFCFVHFIWFTRLFPSRDSWNLRWVSYFFFYTSANNFVFFF